MTGAFLKILKTPKEMATHSSVLAWRIPGTGEPGGLTSMGSHRVGHDWSNLAAAVLLLKQAVQFSSVTQSCLTLCDPMDCSVPGFPVHHQFLELAQTHVHRVSDAIQPSNPLSSTSAFNLSQHQTTLQVNLCCRDEERREGGTKAWFRTPSPPPPLHFSFAWGRSYLSGTSEGTWLLTHSAFTIFGSRVSFVPKLFEMSSSSVN